MTIVNVIDGPRFVISLNSKVDFHKQITVKKKVIIVPGYSRGVYGEQHFKTAYIHFYQNDYEIPMHSGGP